MQHSYESKLPQVYITRSIVRKHLKDPMTVNLLKTNNVHSRIFSAWIKGKGKYTFRIDAKTLFCGLLRNGNATDSYREWHCWKESLKHECVKPEAVVILLR